MADKLKKKQTRTIVVVLCLIILIVVIVNIMRNYLYNLNYIKKRNNQVKEILFDFTGRYASGNNIDEMYLSVIQIGDHYEDLAKLFYFKKDLNISEKISGEEKKIIMKYFFDYYALFGFFNIENYLYLEFDSNYFLIKKKLAKISN